MKRFAHLLKVSVIFPFILFIALLNISCQYDYSSPLPGIIQIRLKTVSNNIPFSPVNNFAINIGKVEAVRSDGSLAIIFEDIKAILVKTIKVNTLDYRARDSSLVIGESNVPPGEYSGANLLVSPANTVILRGYQIINVYPAEGFDPLLYFRKSFSVKESQTTVITIMIDLDQTLVKGAFDYSFDPYYQITSITTQ